MVKEQLGRRVLRDGCHGSDVAELQRHLSTLGYNPGQVDGAYGLLTEEAVLRLQRDFGLRADGIAGPAVFRVLKEGPSTGLRVIHVVEAGDTMTGLAERYRISTRFFRDYQRVYRDKDLFPGRQLAIPVRPVYAWISGEEDPDKLRNSLARHFEMMTALIVPWYNVTSDGSLEGKLRPDLWEWSKSRFFPLIPRVEVSADSGIIAKRNRHRLAQELSQAIRRYAHPGVAFCPSAGAESDSLAYLSAAMEIRNALPKKTSLILKQPPEQGGLFHPGPRPAELAAVADRVLISPTPPSSSQAQPSSSDGEGSASGLKRLVKSLLPEIPCWKLLPKIDALDLEALSQLSLINRYNLAGAAISGLGRDRELLWRGIADRFSPAPHKA